MTLRSMLKGLLIFLRLFVICTGFMQENCTNHKHEFEKVFSVPGDVAMLSSTLVSQDVFNFTNVPYNITWYDSKTGQEINNQTGQILVQRQTLWFLKVTLEKNGSYMTILRTPFRCFREHIQLIVDQPAVAGNSQENCERPRIITQPIAKGVSGLLDCPLRKHLNTLKSHNISFGKIKWYKGCNLITPGAEKYVFPDEVTLLINKVHPDDRGTYTCSLNYTLAGVRGSMSESVNAHVTVSCTSVPEIREPFSETIKAPIGSNFSKRCLAFVPCEGKRPSIGVKWLVRGKLIYTSDHIYMEDRRYFTDQDYPREGYFFERTLVFTNVKEEDFYQNYTCEVDYAKTSAYFTLLPPDPNIILPIGLVFTGITVVFIGAVIVYHIFKIHIVLWFRRVFPGFYPNKDLDGKLYDAYVAYPQPCDSGFSEEIEKFALHTLPEVLEEAFGYQLFIAGRDCLPGHAIVDSVEENLQASRRVLLLYTASTFMNLDCDKPSDKQPKFEYAAAMYKDLLEGSLRVVLVELEEISPAQLALFPESVRQLRKKQGAVCLWKDKRKRRSSRSCMQRREDEEKGEQDTELSPSLSASSRFWKEIRYHLPVKGKRKVTLKKLPCSTYDGV